MEKETLNDLTLVDVKPQNETMEEILKEILQLKDLFVRRLYEDKTKTAAFEQLSSVNVKLSNLLEEKSMHQFIKEILLVCDRIDAQERPSDFVQSIYDEIQEILHRRNITSLSNFEEFDSRCHNVVATEPFSPGQPHLSIVGIVRNGYLMNGQLLRPADVVVAIDPAKSNRNRD